MHLHSIVLTNGMPGGVMVTSLTGHVVIAPKQQRAILRVRSLWVIRMACEEMNKLYARNDESWYAGAVLGYEVRDFGRLA